MNLLNHISIKTRFTGAFILVLLFFTLFALFSIVELNRLAALTATLYNHPLRVSNRALRARTGMFRIHRSMKDVTTAANDLELARAVQAVAVDEQRIYAHLDIVRKQILGAEGKALERETRRQVAAWKPIREEVIRLVLDGNKEAAIAITKQKGADHVADLDRQMLALTSYARNKADGFFDNARGVQRKIYRNTVFFMIAVALSILAVFYFMADGILSNLARLKDTMALITFTGKLEQATVEGRSEISEMATHFNALIDRLHNQLWTREGFNALNNALAGDLPFHELSVAAVNYISRHANACSGAVYVYHETKQRCDLEASFAVVKKAYFAERFEMGQGIVGQVAQEKKPFLLDNISSDQAECHTGTVKAVPTNIYATPLLYEGRLYGVMEIATLEAIKPATIDFLDTAGQILATTWYVARQHEHIEQLYESTRQTNTDLQNRTDELNDANLELTTLNKALKAQSRELRAQSEELKSQKKELEVQRRQVAEADRLKSEFLSNMSHELRTPLNSVLALSQLMISKGTGTHPQKEQEYLKIIERNGRNLLALINDILDLSKIEAGRMDLNLNHFFPAHTISRAIETVQHAADEKSLPIVTVLNSQTQLLSDEDKVYQIILNLLSNAVKFTPQGQIEIMETIHDGTLSFTVKDSGVGIDADQLTVIFDEFRQVDGSTTRNHEGTGLGLAICQKLAHLLGGRVTVESQKGQGSTFTLVLPLNDATTADAEESTDGLAVSPVMAANAATGIVSPRRGAKKLTILVIDDDPQIRRQLGNHLADAGYSVALAESGRRGLALAREVQPFAITLDILMPDMDGLEVLHLLKASDATADVPVIIISVSENRSTGMALGASGYFTKPVEPGIILRELKKLALARRVKRVMLVDDDEVVCTQAGQVLTDAGYQVTCIDNGTDAVERAQVAPPDVMILDIMMPGMDGFMVLERLRATPATHELPVIIMTAKDLTRQETGRLKASTQRIIAKTSPDLDQLFARVLSALAELEARRPAKPAGDRQLILVVEDNEVAALQICSALEENGYRVTVAPGGKQALQMIGEQIPDAVILDLMMPEVDGFKVLEELRSQQRTVELPVLVLTAKELTAEERGRLQRDHIQQLILKGSLDRSQLLARVEKLFGTPPEKRDKPSPRSKPLTGNPRPRTTGSAEVGERQQRPQEAVLVVEDNADNLLILTALLDNYGYTYRTAADGQEALAAAQKQPPPLILMDVQLPVLSGIDTTRRLKAQPETARIPIIALTAHAMKGDREQLMEIGFDGYLSKPIVQTDLLKTLRHWLAPAAAGASGVKPDAAESAHTARPGVPTTRKPPGTKRIRP